MAITIDNVRNTIDFGADSLIKRESANALSTPGSFKATQLIAGASGVKFSDNSIQATAVVVPTLVSAFTNDAGYQTAGNVATAILGKANTSSLATVATSGSYNDLSNKPSIPSAYSLPVATASVLGGVKQGSGITIDGAGVISASGGGSGIATAYDTSNRYAVNTTAGQAVWITTSSPVKSGLSWTRSGTSLTVTDTAHGHAIGDMAIVRNANVDTQNNVITAATTDTFTVTCANSGGTSGSAGAYSMGYTFAHNASGSANINAGTLTAPTGVANVTLLAVRIHLAANTRTGTSYALTVPNQPGGAWSGNDNLVLPIPNVRQDGTSLSAIGNTIACSNGSNWQSFLIGALPASTTGIHMMLNF